MIKYLHLVSKVREGVDTTSDTHLIPLDQGFHVLKDKHGAPIRREQVSSTEPWRSSGPEESCATESVWEEAT